MREQGLRAAARIKAATGCGLFSETFPAVMEQGADLPVVRCIPYLPERAVTMLSPYQVAVLAGVRQPVTFFGYGGFDSHILSKDQQRIHVGTGRQNVVEALECMADALDAPDNSNIPSHVFAEYHRPEAPAGKLTAEKACLTLAALQPENAIIVDEGLTSSFTYESLAAGVTRHSLMAISGGAIGYGLPCAVGAAIACPDRSVIDLQADGSAMYTVQALWTQAREALNITTLICSNRSYHILKVELARAGITSLGSNTLSLTELRHPSIDWVKVARGFGVPAVSVDTAEGLAQELGRALTEPGPHLIEMIL
jgi:acetolactate synthase-1/2/3 large subunit